jgi:hypothetical protein
VYSILTTSGSAASGWNANTAVSVRAAAD